MCLGAVLCWLGVLRYVWLDGPFVFDVRRPCRIVERQKMYFLSHLVHVVGGRDQLLLLVNVAWPELINSFAGITYSLFVSYNCHYFIPVHASSKSRAYLE